MHGPVIVAVGALIGCLAGFFGNDPGLHPDARADFVM
jgi:hypothetical protein